MEEVQGGDIQGGGHGHPGATIGQPVSKVEYGRTVVEAGVDVGSGDVEEPLGLHSVGEAHHDAHRRLRGRTMVAGQVRPVAVGEANAHRPNQQTGGSTSGTTGTMPDTTSSWPTRTRFGSVMSLATMRSSTVVS